MNDTQRPTITFEWFLYGLIVVAALALRLFQLGFHPLNDVEAREALRCCTNCAASATPTSRRTARPISSSPSSASCCSAPARPRPAWARRWPASPWSCCRRSFAISSPAAARWRPARCWPSPPACWRPRAAPMASCWPCSVFPWRWAGCGALCCSAARAGPSGCRATPAARRCRGARHAAAAATWLYVASAGLGLALASGGTFWFGAIALALTVARLALDPARRPGLAGRGVGLAAQ